MSIVKALTTDGGWARVELFGFVVVNGVVNGVIAAPSGAMQSLPLEELRADDRAESHPGFGQLLMARA